MYQVCYQKKKNREEEYITISHIYNFKRKT